MPNALPYEPKTLPYVVCRMSLDKRFCRDLATCGRCCLWRRTLPYVPSSSTANVLQIGTFRGDIPRQLDGVCLAWLVPWGWLGAVRVSSVGGCWGAARLAVVADGGPSLAGFSRGYGCFWRSWPCRHGRVVDCVSFLYEICFDLTPRVWGQLYRIGRSRTARSEHFEPFRPYGGRVGQLSKWSALPAQAAG
jgi:hypothetical protein